LVQVAALLTLVLVIVVNLALGLLPRVDNFAHIGGLISGFVFFIRSQFAWQRRVSAAAAEAPQPGGQPTRTRSPSSAPAAGTRRTSSRRPRTRRRTGSTTSNQLCT